MIRKAGHVAPDQLLTILYAVARRRGVANVSDLFVRPGKRNGDLKRDLKNWTLCEKTLAASDAPPPLRPMLGSHTINQVNGYGVCVTTPNGVPLYLFGYLDYRHRMRAVIVPNGQPLNRLARCPFGTHPLDDDIASEQLGFANYRHLKQASVRQDGASLYDTTAIEHELARRLILDDA